MNKHANTTPSFHRRKSLLGAALAAAFLLPATTMAATTSKTQFGDVTVKNVSFKNQAIKMAGNIYTPKGFDQKNKYATVVVVHPGGGVKEQAAGLYAQKLAEQGFVALTFDASHQGASGGLPRFLEDPTKRVEDVRVAVDYLTTLAYVDTGRIGALGICAGGGRGVKKNLGEALNWFQEGALRGNVQAMRAIGRALDEGVDGVSDRATAESWFCKAAVADTTWQSPGGVAATGAIKQLASLKRCISVENPWPAAQALYSSLASTFPSSVFAQAELLALSNSAISAIVDSDE